MEGDKEDHKRNGKRDKFDRTQEEVRKGNQELGGFITFYAYDVDEEGGESKSEETEDEWGLVPGLETSLNQRGRWNLPSLLEDLQEETWDLLKRGELGKRPLVVVTFEQPKHRVNESKMDNKVQERDRLINKFDSEKETAKEFKVINGRSGKKVVETGARSEHLKSERKRHECLRLEEATGVKLHIGRTHYYIIDSPDYKAKTPKYRHGECSCIRCQGWRGQHGGEDSPRFRKLRNLMDGQL